MRPQGCEAHVARLEGLSVVDPDNLVQGAAPLFSQFVGAGHT